MHSWIPSPQDKTISIFSVTHKLLRILKPEGSLLCSKGPTIGPYFETNCYGTHLSFPYFYDRF
jgi:hypothetical protein